MSGRSCVPGSVDVTERFGERFPLQQFSMRLGGLDQFILVLVEQGGALVLRQPAGALQRRWPRPPPCTAPCRSVSARCLSSSRRASAAFCTEPVSATNWATLPQAGAVDGRAGCLAHDVAGQHAKVDVPELLGVVSQQAFCHELEQHRVVAFEGGVDVEVGTERREAVLDQEASAAAGFTAFLQRIQRVPGAERLECGGERLQVLAVLVRVMGPEKTSSNFCSSCSCRQSRPRRWWPAG
jgi:hypothetical protein